MTDERDSDTAKEFLQVFRRGVQFTEQLLAENERLRFRLAQLEQEHRALSEKALGSESFRDLVDRMSCLEEEKQVLMEQFVGIEGENRDYAQRYRDMEAETDRLANLYVAIYQLHSTLDLQEVVRISFEILINLVGAGRFVLYVADGQRLVPVRAHGREPGEVQTPAAGVAGRALEAGELYLSDQPFDGLAPDEPVACVPLQVAERRLGLFVVERLLPQKSRFSELDHELLRLLATHAGMALYASALSAKVGEGGRDVVAVLLGIGAAGASGGTSDSEGTG